MGRNKYKQLYDGDWVRPVRKGFRTRCCDCGLVHDKEFRIVKYRGKNVIVYRSKRNSIATANARRGAGQKEKLAELALGKSVKGTTR